GSAKNYMFINTTHGLNLREKPTTKSKKITTIPYQSKVILLDENGPEETIYEKEGKWVKIQFKKNTGWVFGPFLSWLKLPFRNTHQYQSIDDDIVKIKLYPDQTFIIIVNLCEGWGEAKGKYQIFYDRIECQVTQHDFSGFTGDQITNFQLVKWMENQVKYEGEPIACGPHFGHIFTRK
ncbi:MAG: SH3 domain-containing protein, partial [Spirochaetes bacterium]|nr:SH3 domain-containing protein [Spirochaetota bacterium]